MEIVLLFLIPIGLIFGIMIILLTMYHFIVYPLRTKKWRKQIKKGDLCKFYILEEKYIGKIAQVFGKSVTVRYLDNKNKIARCSSLITNTYPTW